MPSRSDDLQERLRQAFIQEASEHLISVAKSLENLDSVKPDEREELIDQMFRDLHNIKGSARAANFSEFESICHTLENVFVLLKQNALSLTTDLVEVLKDSVSALSQVINPSLQPGSGAGQKSKLLDSMVMRLESFMSLNETKEAPATKESLEPSSELDLDVMRSKLVEAKHRIESRPPLENSDDKSQSTHREVAMKSMPEFVRISSEKVDGVLGRTEELLSIKSFMSHHSKELYSLEALFDAWTKDWNKISSLQANLRRMIGDQSRANFSDQDLQRMINLIEWSQEHQGAIAGKMRSIINAADIGIDLTENLVNDLYEETKRFLMVPFLRLIETFPLMVRDLSASLGKSVEFKMKGSEVLIDNRILAALKDPLVHLIRNSLDHGLESTEQRQKEGKPGKASLTLDVSEPEANMVQITITDDGRGIDVDKVIDAAVRSGKISQAVASNTSLINLISLPSVSTSQIVSEISGRGMGMSIVVERITSIGGRINLETQPGIGTTFIIQIPSTLASFKCLLLSVGSRLVAISISSIARVLLVKPDMVKVNEGRPGIFIDDKLTPVVRLAEVLAISNQRESQASSDHQLAILLKGKGTSAVFIVDEVVDQLQLVIKPLPLPLKTVRFVSGLASIGAGRVVPILNSVDLILAARSGDYSEIKSESKPDKKAQYKVLVVDDALTARILMKNIIGSAGYQVKTATDGMEALSLLKLESFDLVISDVEMPKMNGFELTAAIRKEISPRLPIIIVTSRDKKEDREKGVQAGANAYFVKSSFDQANLLDVVKRFLVGAEQSK